jgi:hypothetical protein
MENKPRVDASIDKTKPFGPEAPYSYLQESDLHHLESSNKSVVGVDMRNRKRLERAK